MLKINSNTIADFIAYFQEAEVCIILAGAGMSADSGIPTYRGENGAWGRFEKEFEKNITEIMTPQFIQDNPVDMWKRFSKGWAYLKTIQPHEGYQILLYWIQKRNLPYFVITSNVDGQFRKAGFDEHQIYEVHGTSGYLQCTLPCWNKVWQEDYDLFYREDLKVEDLPKCPNCGSLVRPNVYIFKDKTFVPTRTRAQKERLDDFLRIHQGKKNLVFEIGAGEVVKTIRNFTNKFKQEHPSKVIRINPHQASIEAPHLSIPMGALEALHELNQFL